jgi:hypothetical protein
MHPGRQPLERRRDEQVEVRRHQAVGEALPAVLPDDPLQTDEEEPVVDVVVEDLAEGNAAVGDVVDALRRKV